MTDDELKKKLTPGQYKVLREGGTEAPYSGKYHKETAKGMYKCAACGNQLFSSDTKFESKEPGLKGWPSFDEALPNAVKFVEDKSMGMKRTEVQCAKCGSHLGHVFDEAEDSPSGKHYCINGCALNFAKRGKNKS